MASWFASESVSHPEIARRLNKLGITPTYSDLWDGADIRKLLRNKIYIGIQTFGKASRGDHYEVRGGRVVERQTREYEVRDEQDHVESKELFDPIIPLSLWKDVQKKIKETPAKKHVPKSSALWLAGLVRCAGCGRNMRGVSYGSRNSHKPQYICSTYSESRQRGQTCACQRNAVDHDIIETNIRRYLAEIGADLGLVLQAQKSGDPSILKPLIDKQVAGMQALFEAQSRIVSDLGGTEGDDQLGIFMSGQISFLEAKGDPEAMRMFRNNASIFADEYESMYRKMFVRAETGLREELERLDAEHTRMTQSYQGIAGERARAKVNAQIADLEAKMDDLDQRLGNAADRSDELREELVRLGGDLSAAQSSIEGDDQRRCAAAVGRVIDHVLCRFEPTGRKCPTSSLIEVVVVPKSGDAVGYPLDASRPGRRWTWSGRWGSSSATATSAGPAWTTGRGWT